MRAALLLLLGLVIGVIGTVNVVNALNARNPMPHAVMVTMDYHMGQLAHALKARQCNAVKIRQQLERLQSTATDIVPVFDASDTPFNYDAGQLQGKIELALHAAPIDCAALAAVIKPIGGACKTCHQKYR